MRRVIALSLLLALGGLAVLYLSGGDRVVVAWAAEGQRAAQTAMAHALRALRSGDPGALATLLAVCFGYGFFHAAGPGHGKLLIGGFGAARAVGAWRLSAVALAASLAQGATAIALVAVGLWGVGWGRERMTDMAERLFDPLSFGAIALVGLWLAARGLRAAWRLGRAPQDHEHHGDGAVCASCGHAHAPDPAAVAAATSGREIAALVGAVALRPCTGALFVLILTAQMGIFALGVAGVVAMALGTASVTVAVALAAVWARRGLIGGLSGGAARLAHVQPGIEIAVGLVIAWIAGGLALAAL
jgi:ABC-type nickel/cobalt efflux system permease component RcnA